MLYFRLNESFHSILIQKTCPFPAWRGFCFDGIHLYVFEKGPEKFVCITGVSVLPKFRLIEVLL